MATGSDRAGIGDRSAADDGIAVIGAACRLPKAADMRALWRLLRDGGSAIADAPADRCGPDASGATRRGGFLDRVDGFDADFFGIAPREARAMDPQQRLVLELAWEALEDSGIIADRVRGSRTGVFLGCAADDYATLLHRRAPRAIGRHTSTGLQRGIIANRVSYALGLRGPSMVVDSAQSSSLVAVHLACENLRSGEADLALAGGVNLILAPESSVCVEEFGSLSPDGRCYTFDARANGYVRGEGGGVVVLKPLSRAVADGDPIYCVIRGGAVNNDGAGDGLTVPDSLAQREVIRAAYAASGVDPAEVQYVELHGTGTKVGDPVEASALGAALGAVRPPGSPLPVGSAKTNVGHLEGAAGIVGLLKVALAIRHRRLPPSLNFETPNPAIPLDSLNLAVQRELGPWPRPDRPLTAGASSFGMGGTNCHVVVTEPPAAETDVPGGGIAGTVPWLVSAKTQEALCAQAARLHAHLREHREWSPSDVAWSLATTRSQHAHRAAILGRDEEELLARLEELAQGGEGSGLVRGVATGGSGVAMLFSGQGSQRAGMGRELHRAFPEFAEAWDEVCEHLDPLLGLDRPLTEIVFTGSQDALNETLIAQPALFALQVALFRLFEGHGIGADFLIGHSVGELSAAHISGILTLPDAATLLAARARLMQSLPASGVMAAVHATEAELTRSHPELADPASGVAIAALNAPDSTVISGDPEPVDAILRHWRRAGRHVRRLRTSRAFHSPHCDAILDEFESTAARLTYHRPGIPIVSTLTGDRSDAITTPGYWVRQLRDPVRFHPALARLHRDHEATHHLELGPGTTLTTLAREVHGDIPAIPALHPDLPEPESVLTCLARAHATGVPVDWTALLPAGRRIDLPTYAFQRKRYWLDEETTGDEPVAEPAAKTEQDPLELVRSQAAAILGHSSPEDVEPRRTLRELGFDSLGTVELRDRLCAATGLRLTTAALYSYPTPAELADHLRAELAGGGAPTGLKPSAGDEPIAIVGMACRLPGGARSPEDLWRLVASGADAISGFPTDRGWDLDALFDPDPDAPGKSYARQGGFLHDAASFDPAFFGISPREALAMDPQQRLLLETSWEALERAGIDPAALRGTCTGTFVGATAQDYGPRLDQCGEGHALTGTTPSILSGRIAYSLGLHGPAFTVDTACSSSLVAMHLACESLRSGESGLALAGGVTVMATPGMFIEFSRQRGLAKDGRCKAFSADADGTSWAEGVGVVVLERLSEAVRNGRRVLAVIRGSAINQDGASNGLTAPSGVAQERVILQALANAGLTPADVDAVEAHGTGTALGDPIEAQALFATYGKHHSPERPVWLGSLKSNIGHTQAAAGVAGVIKMVQALHHEELPATLHADEPSPHADWSSGALALLDQPRPWPKGERPRRAAVSSFGISGTNAHLVLEQPPAIESAIATADSGAVPWVISARTPETVASQAERLLSHLGDRDDWTPAEVARSLATTRTAFAHRAAIVGTDRRELLAGLASLAGSEDAGVVRGIAADQPSVAMLLSGQGSQRPGMGRGLHEAFPVFAQAWDEACAHLDPLLGLDRPLTDIVFHGDDAEVERTLVAQPALFALQVALFRLLEHHGIVPDHLIGHSIGELTAAHLAGVLSLPDAAALLAGRARLMQALPAHGVMAGIQAGEQELLDAHPQLHDPRSGVSIAAVNAPQSTVVSGDPDAVHAIREHWRGQGRTVRDLHTSRAFHSPHCEPLLDELEHIARELTFHPPKIPIISTVTGTITDELTTPAYWARQVRRPVRFAPALAWLHEHHSVTHHLELGPDATLTTLARTTHDTPGYPTLRAGTDDTTAYVTALAGAHTTGLLVRWPALLPPSRTIDLPTYAFQHQRYWLNAERSAGRPETLGLASTGHPLLAARVDMPQTGETVFTGRISLETRPWLADHVVQDTVLLPGTALLDMTLHAAAQLDCAVEELTLHTPLALPDHGHLALRLTIAPETESGNRDVTIHSRDEAQEWVQHAAGVLRIDVQQPRGNLPATAPPEHATPVDLADAYDVFSDRGLDYGPAFQGLQALWEDGDDLYAEVALPEEAGAGGWAIHPALLDPAVQAALLPRLGDSQDALLPFSWNGIRLHQRGAQRLRVGIRPVGSGTIRIAAADETGNPVAEVEALTLRPAATAGGRDAELLRLTWTQLTADLPAESGDPRPDVVLADFRAIDPSEDVPACVARVAREALDQVQSWLPDGAETRLALVTRGAVAVQPGEVPDLVTGPLWGLLRVAQNEHPDRILLVDADAHTDPAGLRQAVGVALRQGEPQIAVRGDSLLVPRLTRSQEVLAPPEGRAWRLDVTERGSIDNLHLAAFAAAEGPLSAGQVRVAVRAVGLNFRDVLNTLGMYPGTPPLGIEVAGVVTEAASDVDRLSVGDRVAGMLPGAMGPLAVGDHRVFARVPQDWTFAQAAATPAVFLTAYLALHGLAEVQPGQRVLVHAAAGGVGMAAIQLLQHYGADIYATAHPTKWELLRELGIPDDHIASSRTPDFATRFPAMDVVLNSLTGELLDASLDLLTPGGHFVELGKTDPRAPSGLHYHTFDLTEADPGHLQAMLGDLTALFASGDLTPLPVTAWDIRRAPEAFRHLSNARHTGKLALTIPTTPDPRGTILITGGTGSLGTVLARHLAAQHPAHLLLASRQGPAAPGAAQLRDELRSLGADVSIAACDFADSDAVQRLLDTIPADRPLTGVVHAAGALHDAPVHALTAEQLATVLRSKVDSAWNLHHATRDHDLAFFAFYSSAAALLGNPGQANYAAANTFLDALAEHRHAQGLPALSLAWGPWNTSDGMTQHLTRGERERMASIGMHFLDPDEALRLFDQARGNPGPYLAPLRLDNKRRPVALLSELAPGRARTRRAAAPSSLAGRLAAVPEAQRHRVVLELVQTHAAAVLGHSDPASIDARSSFKSLGFDSLTSVELRNRLAATTGLSLPPGLIFDHPRPWTLSDRLCALLLADRPKPRPGPRTTRRADDEPIAIVGMACRLPGSVHSPDELWQLVASGADAITGFPTNRGWDLDDLFDPDPDASGKSYARHGGFLHHADQFDPAFFGISPREALAMDPQQRLLLETTWEVLENAGIDPGELRGSPTGVFVGAIPQDYGARLHNAAKAVEGHVLTGTTSSAISGRVAYLLGLEGPAVTVDTACSSSLVAMHLACQSLRSGESSMALTGGATVMATPGMFIEFSRQRGLAPDGRCKAFSADADGTSWAEGAGVVALERLSDAERNGHRVLAVIRGSAVNQDGASNGLTAPNGPSQERVILQALANAGLTPADVDAVEAHGTGTSLGDPIEAQALLATYGQHHTVERPVWLGSLKSNIGHSQAAAGVAGVIKMVQAFHHDELPATLHADEPSPHIDWSSGALALLAKSQPWPETGRPRRAAVSSFGVSGTNAHLILEQAPPEESTQDGIPAEIVVGTGDLVPWVVSARTPDALAAQAARLHDHLVQDSGWTPSTVAWSLATTRAALEHRAVILGRDRDELLNELRALARGEVSPRIMPRTGPMTPDPDRVVLVFPGQGGQWPGMGRELLDTSPVFAAALAECDQALSRYQDWSVTDLLRNGDALERVDVIQPALFAVMVSLTRVWQALGVQPAAVVGHSQGEIAAAHIAGALDLDQAARVVALRSQLIRTHLAGHGSMLSTALSVDNLKPHLDERISVAAINSPTATVLSGDTDAIHDLHAALTDQGVRSRVLPVDYASHSHHVETLRRPLLGQLAGLAPKPSAIPFHSTVTGAALDTTELDADYWYTNLATTVDFHRTITQLNAAGHHTYLEPGPHPTLSHHISTIAADATSATTLHRDHPGRDTLLANAAHLWANGTPIAWQAVLPAGERIALPTYPFQRERFWLAPATTRVADSEDTGRPKSDTTSTAKLRQQLARLPAHQRHTHLLDHVIRHAAAVLNYADPEAIPTHHTFQQIGYDSVTAIQLRNQLAATTRISLPATLIYDHPTPTQLADHLLELLLGEPSSRSTQDSAAVDEREPIAIVGMACRLPGGVASPDQLWDLVAAATDAISDFPPNRGWDLQRLFHPDPDNPGTTYCRQGGFLLDAAEFDPAFFGISPREALAMDPQQRLLLETTWEAIENAGIDPATLRGTATGTFVGATAQDYGPPLHQVAPDSAGHALTGTTPSVMSGRVAYTLGLEGPAVTVDTACSSSLVAMHLACQSLRSGEARLALAGGVTIMAAPGIFLEFSRQRGLARDGRCKAFSAAADGTTWSEGVGVVMLERLSDAQRNGHRILAVIRGSAINQDGASNGLTAPNGPSQERVIQQALANAGLAPADIDAVEAHGTGTSLGDPIEAQALLATYGQHHNAEQPLWLGSLKSNIGHTQAAAGVAGVIKMVQALQHNQLPATLHAEEPSTHIDWSSGALALLTESRSWPEDDRPRRAAVSSFGVSGTNAHLILEQAPLNESTMELADSVQVPWLISAKSPEALTVQAERLHAQLRDRDDWSPAEVAWSLATTRAAFEHRAAILGSDREELLAGLENLARGLDADGIVRGLATSRRNHVAMLLSGQGSQRPGMGRGLHEAFPVFAEAWDEACEHLDPLLGLDRPLTDIVFHGKPEEVEDTLIAQPALFALQVGLFRLLEHHGITPDYLIGHSIGELTAAHLAGVLTLPDAARLLAERAQLMRTLPGTGVMASVQAGEGELTDAHPELLAPDSGVSIAAINSPQSTVISGDPGPVRAITGHWRNQGRTTRELHTSRAFHSPHCEPLVDALEQAARELTYHPPTIPVISTATGTITDDIATPAYWARQIRRAVRFHPALTWLHQNHAVTHHIELGPDTTLSTLARTTHDTPSHATLKPGTDDTTAYLAALTCAHTTGLSPRWATLLAPARTFDLPTYAFQRQRYWLSPTASAGSPEALGLDSGGHPLLSARTDVPGTGEVIFTGRVSLDDHPWLADHVVQGTVLLPGTAFLDMALHVAAGLGHQLDDLTVLAPLELPEHGHIALHVTATAVDDDGRRSLSIHSRGEGESWTRHATATTSGAEDDDTPDLAAWPPEGAVAVDVGDLYDVLAGQGFDYGPAFRGLHAAWRLGDDIYAEVALPDESGAPAWTIHPALLDATQHAAVIGDDRGDGRTRLVFSWANIRLHLAGSSRLRVRLRHTGEDTMALAMADHTGRPVATIGALTLRRSTGGRSGELFHVDWVPHVSEPGDEAPEALVLDYRSPAGSGSVPARVEGLVQEVLGQVQEWLSDAEQPATHLVVLTRGAVAVHPGETADLVTGPLWGLLRVAQNEHPDRILLVDTDEPHQDVPDLLRRAIASGSWQLALRGGAVFAPRLSRADSRQELEPPESGAWRLDVTERGSIDNLHLASFPEAEAPLAAGQVRVAVRAVGVNFRDVLNTLGMYPGTPPLGIEGSGVISEVAGDVGDLSVGDRVWGILPGAMGPLVVTDHRLLATVPDGWSFAQAATAPAVFLTTYHALHHLAEVQPGQKVLVHAAAGGIGMAAIQLLQHCGADIYATAHPSKWATLRELGIPADHIASSRTPDFGTQFPPVEVVLNSLTGELLDASLDLLTPGGYFIELGKADPRDPAEHPGLHYHAFDLTEVDPAHLQTMLGDLTALFDQEHIRPLPVTAWDIRQAPEAFRHLSNARHTGKLALTIPTAPEPNGTILITGGTGSLGSVMARHLATRYPGCHLLLASRRGPTAPSAESLRDELTAFGAKVTIAACDITDAGQVTDLIDGIHAEHPLTGVVHTTGVLRDAPVHALTAEQVAAVLKSKVDSAWNLHRATQRQDLAFFVLYSSAAGFLGNPGQANYAAANTFLDAFARYRRIQGLPAHSLAWGPWSTGDGMTQHLTHADQQRMANSGALPFEPEDGIRLFDEALGSSEPMLLPIKIDPKALRRHQAPTSLAGRIPEQRGEAQPRNAEPLMARLQGMPEQHQHRTVLEVIRMHAAAVLGHAGFDDIPADRPFLELGFDSLTSVELRNRLATATELRLPTTLVFEHPTPHKMATHLRGELVGGDDDAASVLSALSHLEDVLATIPLPADSRSEVLARLTALLGTHHGERGTADDSIDSASDEEIFELIDRDLEQS
ncbi:type I polyketide synthase [Saccharopolyspora shandongensis]